MPLLTRKQNSHETVYRFCQKRISPYPARPAYHADTDRHADCTDYPFRLCHLDRSAQCTDCHPCTFPPDGCTESDGTTGCQRVFHGEICRPVSRRNRTAVPTQPHRTGCSLSLRPASPAFRFGRDTDFSRCHRPEPGRHTEYVCPDNSETSPTNHPASYNHPSLFTTG